jgi:hypothetical protein
MPVARCVPLKRHRPSAAWSADGISGIAAANDGLPDRPARDYQGVFSAL